MAEHYLKILPKFFKEIRNGNKTFEVRKRDRDFKSGDILVLQECTNNSYTGDSYTGEEEIRYVTYVLHGEIWGIRDGYCVMSISKE